MIQRIRRAADYVYRNKGDTLRVRVHRKESGRWNYDVFHPSGSITSYSHEAGDDFKTKRNALAEASYHHGPLTPIATEGTVVDAAWYRTNRRSERDHATRKKTSAQLDAEIAAALAARSTREAVPVPQRTRRRAHARSLFPSDHELATEYLAEGNFKKLHAGVTKKGEPFEIYGDDKGSYTIRLSDTLKEIGTAYLATKWAESKHEQQGLHDYISIVRIDPKYKRQGVATSLYETIERHTGKPLRPSPLDQSDEAKAFWAARTRRT